MTAAELAAKIDHTILKPETLSGDIDGIVDDALQWKFASVCVAPIYVSHIARRLSGSGILPCAVSGFPHGTSKAVVKAIESSNAVKDGAVEVDVVAHVPYLLAENVDAARAELAEVVRAVRATRKDAVIKVIVESAALMSGVDAVWADRRIKAACQAVRESGADFIKTSTGFHPAGGASIEAVRLMKKHSDGLLVKASGGIRDLAAAMAMLDAGADRLGLRASKNIRSAANDLPRGCPFLLSWRTPCQSCWSRMIFGGLSNHCCPGISRVPGAAGRRRGTVCA